VYIDLLYLKVEAFSIGVSLKRSKQLLSDRSYRTLLNRAARLSRSETLLQMFTLSRTSLTFGNTSLRIGYSNPPVYRKVGHLESMAKQPSNYHPGNTQNSMFSGVVLIFPIWDRPSHDDTIAIECWWMMGTCQTNWVSGLDGHMIIYICTIWAYILHIYHIYIHMYILCSIYAVYGWPENYRYPSRQVCVVTKNRNLFDPIADSFRDLVWLIIIGWVYWVALANRNWVEPLVTNRCISNKDTLHSLI
jgi:hypothetical protein